MQANTPLDYDDEYNEDYYYSLRTRPNIFLNGP